MFLLFAKQIIDSQSLAAWVAAVRFRFSPLDRHCSAALFLCKTKNCAILAWILVGPVGQRSVQKKEYPIFQVRCSSSPGKDTRHNCLSALQQCQSWPRSCLLFCNSSFRAAVRLFRGSTPSFGLVGISQFISLVVKINYFCSRPKGCEARHRVAIIVPYRDREPHLRYFRLFETSGKMTWLKSNFLLQSFLVEHTPVSPEAAGITLTF